MKGPSHPDEIQRLLQRLKLAGNSLSLSELSEQAHIPDLTGLRLLLNRLESDHIVLAHTSNSSSGCVRYSVNQNFAHSGNAASAGDDNSGEVSPGAFGAKPPIDFPRTDLLPKEEVSATSHSNDLDLIEVWMKGGQAESQKAIERLLSKFYPDIRRIAQSLCWDNSMQEDLVQEGVLACLSGFKVFDAFKSSNLRFYIRQRIERRMLRYVAKYALAIRLPENTLNDQTKFRHSKEELTGKLGREPTRLEIGVETGMSEKKIELLLELERRGNLASLDQPLVSENDDASLEELLECSDSRNPDVSIEQAELYEQVKKFLDTLTEQEARILNIRFGIDDGNEKSCEETAQMLKISKQTVSRAQVRGLRKLVNFKTMARELLGESNNLVAHEISVPSESDHVRSPTSSANSVADQIFRRALSVFARDQYRIERTVLVSHLQRVFEANPGLQMFDELSDGNAPTVQIEQLVDLTIERLLSSGLMRTGFSDEFVLTESGVRWMQRKCRQ